MDDVSPKVAHMLDLHERLYRILRSELAEHWVNADFTMPQIKVMVYLHTDGASRMSTIAEALNIALPSATGIVDRLVERGLVVRAQAPTDRRVVNCSLSPEGQRRVSELWAAGMNLLREMFEGLTDDDLTTVRMGTEIMIKAAGKAQERRKPPAKEPMSAPR